MEFLNFDPWHDQINQAIDDAQSADIPKRIWDCDHVIWKPQPDEISNRLGWLNIVQSMLHEIPRLESFADEVKSDGFEKAILLGMGGSSLAPEVFRKVFGIREGYLDLSILDSTDPAAVQAVVESIDPAKTLFIVSTKSGGTAETLSFFKYFYTHMRNQMGSERAGSHFVAITDPGSKLEMMAQKYEFRNVFINDPNIGGRFSALSFFGLVPAVLLGIDLRRLLNEALSMAEQCKNSEITENPGIHLGIALGELAKKGVDKCTFLISTSIKSFGDWVEQLIAESTGKEGMGILPVVGEPLAPPLLYGHDRVFIHICCQNDDCSENAVEELRNDGRPVIRIKMNDTYHLGAQMFLWEMATAIACQRLSINPFDQPDVESAKVLAREMVAAYHQEGRLPESKGTELTVDAFKHFCEQGSLGDYISLQMYIKSSARLDAMLRVLRAKLQDRYKLATTSGYGPRFLHSTGQLHKGDRGNGLFIQFTIDDLTDLKIPDEAGEDPSSMTFGVLKSSQAMGDRQALINAGRRVIHFHLKKDYLTELKAFIEGF